MFFVPLTLNVLSLSLYSLRSLSGLEITMSSKNNNSFHLLIEPLLYVLPSVNHSTDITSFNVHKIRSGLFIGEENALPKAT